MSTTGSCLCNEIQYEFTGTPAVTALCHCTDCQKWSGSSSTSNSVVPRKDFQVTKGTPKSYSITGDSGKENLHWFCANCGSSLYTELEVMPDMTCVKTGSLDKVGVEFYTKDRASYLTPVSGADQKSAFG
ncbi:Putative uncharacterized protein [Taphrina deformans PYCC 5710]|uniref:CENP-V/GFA domain-containing protein n=1 Tax=Taphrina deformans (strain PYCC 5710 / ATCC 11124 / CBS 356.35 / IMI 108563 / JCM 9778 / NBRC 8474) TaxID=1097556 RepID=R4XFJ0_TAPDE|nr:Putative uncharacterized protein [Taphrina deformans PYCC 5710]|eukprot:CCG82097.1 Putative uncharacterized protein [Taphrina deformans PYCC 5710]